jgi:hypothetical protein
MRKNLLLVLFSFSHLFLSARLPDLIPYHQGNLWGYCDSTKKIIIPCKYTYVSLFNGSDSARASLDILGSYTHNGYILKNGDFHADPPPVPYYYNWATAVTTGTYTITFTLPCNRKQLLVYQDSTTQLFGFKNCDGKIVIPCSFMHASEFHEGLCAVIVNDTLSGYINSKGKFVMRFENSTLGDFQNGFATITTNAGMGLINKKGKYIVPPVCINLLFGKNFFFICNESGYDGNSNELYSNGIAINKKGKVIDNRVFNYVTPCDNGFWLVNYNQRFGFLNANGKEVIPMQYSEAKPFEFGIAAVKKNEGYWGYVNETGKEVVPFIYSDVMPFNNNLAAVEDTNGKYGFIDKSGRIILSCKYSEPQRGGFDENGLCETYYYGYIDKYGTEYWEE